MNINGATNATLSLSNVQASDAAGYTCEVSSDCGTAASNIATLTLDNVPPVLNNCPSSITKNMDPGQCGAIISWSTPTASDNCDNNPAVNQTQGPPSGSMISEGVQTIKYLATDASNNVSTECSFTVTVLSDVEKPEFNGTCPSYATPFSTEAGQCFKTITFVSPNPSDNCGIAELKAKIWDSNGNIVQNWTTNPNGQFAPDIYEIKWRAKDEAGNKKICTKTFTVIDNEIPNALCVESHTVQLNNGVGFITTNDIDSGSSDNCNFNLSLSKSNFDCSDRGNTSVTMTITDDSGNTHQCATDIEVLGTTMSIEDISQNEGTGTGYTFFFFKVERAAGGCIDQVDYSTTNGTATLADNDYLNQSGTHYFTSSGSNIRYIIVRGTKDANYEGDEHFWINLSNPSPGISFTKDKGKATLVNDDAAPLLSFPNQKIDNLPYIQGQIMQNKAALYPNPVRDEFQLIVPEIWFEEGDIDVVLSNNLGQKLSGFILSGNQTTVNVETLPNGTYQLFFKTKPGIVYMERFIKVN